MKQVIFYILVFLLIPVCLLAQDDYKKYPGYVDLSGIDKFKDSEETVEVFITKPLLSLVASATSEEDPALFNLLKNLALIRVDQFALKETDAKKVRDVISNLSQKLEKERWSRIVRVKESKERVEIFIKEQNGNVAGILVMSVDDNKEAVFVNIVGNIDMQQLGKLSKKFNIPGVDSLNDGSQKKK